MSIEVGTHSIMPAMKTSLIATILNEGESLRGLMDTLAAQTRLPDEIMICDGGSTDNTLAILDQYRDRLPLTVIVREGANISEGRNAAIEAASGDILVFTDAGVRLDPHWFESIIAPFDTDADTQAVAGFFLPDVETPFEVAMGATVLPALEDIDPATFAPSSRSMAARREVILGVGGYPEWLDYCEDLVLDFRIMEQYGGFEFAPDALAYFKPRTTMKSFILQYYRYARGDGKAGLFFRRHLVRYLTYLAALPLLLIVGIALSPWWLLALIPGAAYYTYTPYRRLPTLWGHLDGAGRLAAVLWVPLIRVSGDLAKMVGYPVGVVWRRRNKPPAWR